jgi:hypothetical protein
MAKVNLDESRDAPRNNQSIRPDFELSNLSPELLLKSPAGSTALLQRNPNICGG